MIDQGNNEESLYLFKNGVVEYIPLSEIKESSNDGLGSRMSYEEKNIYDYLIEDGEYNQDFSVGVNLYNALQRAGYSVIKHSFQAQNVNLVNCLLSSKASFEDMRKVYDVFTQIVTPLNDQVDDINLYVYKDAVCPDYHYYNNKGLMSNKKFAAQDVLDCHIRNKQGTLDQDEQAMFDMYENFNMENILYKNVEDYIIHTDGGVIAISDEGYMARNLHRMVHDYDLESVVRRLCPTLKFKNKDSRNKFRYFEDYNISTIRLAYGLVIISVGNNPSITQINCLKSFVNQVAELEEMNGPLLTTMAVHKDSVVKFELDDEEFYDTENILNCLDKMEQKLVHDDVKVKVLQRK